MQKAVHAAAMPCTTLHPRVCAPTCAATGRLFSTIMHCARINLLQYLCLPNQEYALMQKVLCGAR